MVPNFARENFQRYHQQWMPRSIFQQAYLLTVRRDLLLCDSHFRTYRRNSMDISVACVDG